jgi:prepilin-type N-terminal cleavage/methylation domain-containing protein
MLARKGFSLFEILLSMAIISLLLMTGLRSFGSERPRASSAGMALVVAAELEATQAKALSSKTPVAFCLPTDGGTRSYAQSYYLMEGEVVPRAKNPRLFAGDFPNSFLSASYWGTATTTRPKVGDTFAPNFVDRWLGDRVGSDPALVFLPDGTIMSNDLPLMGGEYRILVASSIGATPFRPGGSVQMNRPAQSFALSRVFAAHTISLTPSGDIVVQDGLKDPTGVTIETHAFSPSTEPAAAGIPADPASSDPKISAVEVLPEPYLYPKAAVQKSRNLTLIVEANDNDGQPLYCKWVSTPLTGTEPGTFSQEDDHPMVWDQDKGLWRSETSWAPPTNANIGDQFNLTAEISDPDGHQDTRSEEVLTPVTVVPPSRILFNNNHAGNWNISSLNPEDASLENLTNELGDDRYLAVSPDGSKVAWERDFGGPGEVYVMNMDGSGKVRLTNDNKNEGSFAFTPDGTKLLYCRDYRLYCSNVDGSGSEINIPHGPFSPITYLQFSPDGQYLMYSGYKGAAGHGISSEVVVAEFVDDGVNPPFLKDITNVTDNADQGISDSVPAFVPGGGNSVIYGTAEKGANGFLDGTYKIYLVDLVDTGGTPRFEFQNVQLVSTTFGRNQIYSYFFSPDGKSVVYNRGAAANGAYIAEWRSSPPGFANERKLTRRGGDEIPRAWALVQE